MSALSELRVLLAVYKITEQGSPLFGLPRQGSFLRWDKHVYTFIQAGLAAQNPGSFFIHVFLQGEKCPFSGFFARFSGMIDQNRADNTEMRQ